jgi:hypothetical protein
MAFSERPLCRLRAVSAAMKALTLGNGLWSLLSIYIIYMYIYVYICTYVMTSLLSILIAI